MNRIHRYGWAALAAATVILCAGALVPAAARSGVLGYYRFPAIHDDSLIFTAEGDLWQVGINGGVAQRLTTHPAEESRPAFSPDGRTIAFSAAYEGPTEVYTLSLDGGIPVRQTYDGAAALVVGWTPAGDILYATRRFATLPNTQLARVNPQSGARARIPLAQASDGSYAQDGRTLFSTRLAFQGRYTKRYQGGTAQNQQHDRVAARVLSGVRPRRADHRRPPQHERQHRQLDPREAAAQSVVLLAAARR